MQRFLATRLFFPCAAASAVAVALLVARFAMGAPSHRFLVWNLFLAWLPYLAALGASALARRPGGIVRALQLAALGLVWLLFLPNAPYIMTDFVHLPYMMFVWWYDVGTLLTFAWAGCILGVASLHLMRELVRSRLGAAASWAFVLVSVALSGLGVYFGRFLRWNSWDVLTSPRALAHELLAVLTTVEAYPRLVGVSGMFAVLLLLGYLTLDAVRRTVAGEQ